MKRIYVHEGITPEVRRGLEDDTGSRTYTIPRHRYDNSPIVCPYCGNRSSFSIDLTFEADGEVIDGKVILPDIYKEVSELFNGYHYNSMYLLAGYLEMLKEHFGGVIPLPVTVDGGQKTTLADGFYGSLDTMADTYVDYYLNTEMLECVNCREPIDFRDCRSGYDGKHDDMCSGCFICSSDFPRASEVAEKCSDKLSKVLPNVFPDEFAHARMQDAEMIQDYLTGRLDDIGMNDGIDDCHECQHYYLCLNYRLSMESPEILLPAITKAIHRMEEQKL